MTECTTVCPDCGEYDGPDIDFITHDDTCPECGHRLANEVSFDG